MKSTKHIRYCISTTISGSDIKRLDSCVDVFSETGDATGFGDHRSEDSFIIEVSKLQTGGLLFTVIAKWDPNVFAQDGMEW